MRTIIRRSTAASALLALLLAGCGGGGHASSALPATATNAPVSGGGTSTSKRAPASFTLVIPSGGSKSAAKRSPKYISAAIQSLSVSAVPAAGGTAVTASENVSTCPTVNGAETCTLTVQAPVGSDVFTVTMYDGQNESGNVLGSGTETGTVVIDTTNSFPLTLSGTVATVELSLATPALPVVSGGSTLVAVGGLDAGGYLIIGSYTNAITLTAAAGVTLNPTSVTAAGTSVTATYDGVSKTPLAITAASTGATSATASIIPTTHVVSYTGQTATVGGEADAFRIIKGPDNAYYFGDIGATQSMGSGNIVTGTTGGAIGRIDGATGVVTEVGIAGVDPISLVFNGNDLYFAELASGKIGRILNAGAGGLATPSNYSEQTLPNSPPVTTPPTLTPGTGYAAPRDLLFLPGTTTLVASTYYDQSAVTLDVSTWNATGSSSNVTELPPLNPPAGTTGFGRPAGITYQNGVVYMVCTNDNVVAYTPGSNGLTHVGNTDSTNVPGGGRFAATGPDNNVYFTVNAAGDFTLSGGIFDYDTSGNSATQLPGAVPGWAPDSLHRGSGSTLVASDGAYGSIDVYDVNALAYTIYPLVDEIDSLQQTGANDVADGGDGSFWFTHAENVGETLSSSVTIGHLVLAGWQLLPDTTDTQVIDGTGVNSTSIISVAQAAGNGATVNVTSTANCAVAPAPYTSGQTYLVTGVTPGPCTVTATDQTGRSVMRQFTVTTSSATISSHRRISK
jgi:sugar lactone lactonase YvrE